VLSPPVGRVSVLRGACRPWTATQLHLMEAMTSYYLASRRLLSRERLAELMDIQANTVVRTPGGF